MAGDDDDRPGMTAHLGQATDHFSALHVRHPHIGDDAGGGVLGQVFKEVDPAGETAGADALAAQQDQKGIADAGVVVDDEYGMEAHAFSTLGSRFRVKEKAAPPSALLETCSRPP
ncbi:hypothetical protein D3C85_1390040 [compost metagenome]